MFNHSNKLFTIYEVAEAVGKAYKASFTPKNIRSGFKSTGIYPLNLDCFTDDDYLCSYISERPAPPTTPLLSILSTPPAVSLQSEFFLSFSPFDKPTSTPNKLSYFEELSSSFEKPVQSSKQKLIVSPASIMPYPKGSLLPILYNLLKLIYFPTGGPF